MELSTRLGHVNGTKIYREVRGQGPPLLFVSGATGDAGHFEAVADRLADAFTVVTYDRRGNSRSPRPDGWTRTTIEEQADDAAALVESLGMGPVGVFGTSGGAIIALAMLLRRPDLVRAAVLHEPPLGAVVEGAAEGLSAMKQALEQAMAAGGPSAALETFLRANGAAVDRIPPGTLARMRGNAETLFGAELEAFVTYAPDPAAIARIPVPVRLAVGTRTTPLFTGATRWLAGHLNAPMHEIPGGHTPYFEHPEVLAAALRPFFREVAR